MCVVVGSVSCCQIPIIDSADLSFFFLSPSLNVSHIFQYIKTQLQLARSKNSDVVFKGPWDCVQKTVRANGIKGLYVGVNTLVLGSFFKSGVRFFTFDAIKNAIVPANST